MSNVKNEKNHSKTHLFRLNISVSVWVCLIFLSMSARVVSFVLKKTNKTEVLKCKLSRKKTIQKKYTKCYHIYFLNIYIYMHINRRFIHKIVKSNQKISHIIFFAIFCFNWIHCYTYIFTRCARCDFPKKKQLFSHYFFCYSFVIFYITIICSMDAALFLWFYKILLFLVFSFSFLFSRLKTTRRQSRTFLRRLESVCRRAVAAFRMAVNRYDWNMYELLVSFALVHRQLNEL